MSRSRWPAIFLVAFATAGGVAPAEQLSVIPPGIGAIMPRLDTWSQVQEGLSASQPTRAKPSTNLRDFHAALRHARGRKVAAAPSIEAYAERMGLLEAGSFKGFAYEQSIVRRWNSRAVSRRYRVASHGDTFIDIEEYNPTTNKTLRRLQAYGGKSQKAALEKLFGSDSAADKLIVPSDVYDKIKRGFQQATLEWEKLPADGPGRQERIREISRDLLRDAKAVLNPETGECFQVRSGNKLSLGVLGSKSQRAGLGKLVRDRFTSATVQQLQVHAQLLSTEQGLLLISQLGDSPYLLDSVYDHVVRRKRSLVRQNQPRSFLTSGEVTSLSQKVLKEVTSIQSESLWSEYTAARRNAILCGVDVEKVQSSLRTQFADKGQDLATPRAAISEATEALNKSSKQSLAREAAAGRALVGAMTIAGGLIHFAADKVLAEKDLSQWVEEGHLVAWTARAGVGLASYEAARAAEQLAIRQITVQGGKDAAVGLSGRLLGRVAAGSVAGALFVSGESLIQVCIYQANSKEALEAAKQTAIVIFVSEGAVFAAEAIASAAGVGTLGGPFGIAIAVGAAATYEGGKYVFYAHHDYVAANKVFLAKANAAESALEKWSTATIKSFSN